MVQADFSIDAAEQNILRPLRQSATAIWTVLTVAAFSLIAPGRSKIWVVIAEGQAAKHEHAAEQRAPSPPRPVGHAAPPSLCIIHAAANHVEPRVAFDAQWRCGMARIVTPLVQPPPRRQVRNMLGPWTIGAVLLIILGAVAWVASATAAGFHVSASPSCSLTSGSPLQLSGCDLRGVDLGSADLQRASLLGAQLDGAQLQHQDLRGLKASGAQFPGADLSGASLEGAELSGADLRSTDLRGACLQGADLRDADLRQSNMQGADLAGADLDGTQLAGASMPASGTGLPPTSSRSSCT